MKKKILVVLISILVILLLIIIARECILNFDGFLDNNNSISRDEAKSLILKGNNQNFKLTRIIDNDKYEYYNRDNIVAVYKNGNLVSWVDAKNSLSYSFNTNDKTAIETTQFKATEYSQYGRPFDEINNLQMEYKYLGEKNINNRTTYIITLNSNNHIVKLYIDSSTGVVINRKEMFKSIITTHYTNENFEVSFDTVTEKDIALPNLDDYTITKNT